jgi:hypothetical protein
MSKIKSLIHIVVIALLSLSLLNVVSVSAEVITVNGAGTISTGSQMSSRIFRDAVPSDCGGKAFPGTFGGTFAYNVEGAFGPIATDSCATVTWDLMCPSGSTTNVHPVAFKTGFDPAWGASNTANYLGDPGSSIPGTFSFPVSAGDSFVIVFMNTASVEDCSYTYSVTYDGTPVEDTKGLACGLNVPEGSVVGDLPFKTQVFYEPGNVSPGVFIEPGTYIVIGQDKTETYYKIVLACQYVWVPKAVMQPSYLPPQNGAPLPTRIVDATSGDASGSANDVGK